MTTLRLSVLLLALTLLSSAVQAQSEDPVKHGRQLVTLFCSSCHAVGPYFRSRNPGAPLFRTLGRTFDLDGFPAMLERGISAAHPDMPVFKFSPDDAHDVVVYLRSIQQ
jgi:mono/diheme cytochrome c family protein